MMVHAVKTSREDSSTAVSLDRIEAQVEIMRKLDSFSKKLDTIGKEDLLNSIPEWLALAAAAHVTLAYCERKRAIDSINRKISKASKRNGLAVRSVDLSPPIKKMYEAKARGDEDLKKEIHAFYEDVGKKYGGSTPTIAEGDMFIYVKKYAMPLRFNSLHMPQQVASTPGLSASGQQDKYEDETEKKRAEEKRKAEKQAREESAKALMRNLNDTAGGGENL